MEQKLFRKESLDRISSPDQLNQYIRVSNPSVWLILSAVVVLLIAVCVWGFTGRLETTLEIKMVSQNGQAVCLLEEEQRTLVKDGMLLRANGETGEIASVSATPMSYEELRSTLGEYVLYTSGVAEGEWRYVAQSTLPLADGGYDANIIIESVSPLSFLLN